MGINQTLKALADPVRRNILEMLDEYLISVRYTR